MSGFQCKFIEKPPEAFQCQCFICWLILREPFQVTCCGKSFCKKCIQRNKARNKPCPTCNEERFDIFPNKGLQQPLYGFKVTCSNKGSGCEWLGELGQLDKHLNLNPGKEDTLVGCVYTEVLCELCQTPYLRQGIERHRTLACRLRPSVCSMCKVYRSSYDDVMNKHATACNYRPVECPNKCGDTSLQYLQLKEHTSTHCPLSIIECEFSDAGCSAKVCRKDLSSHMTKNMVAHMSLLAQENRKLKLQLKKNKTPPVEFQPTLNDLQSRSPWTSQKLYSHFGGYCVKAEFIFTSTTILESLRCNVVYVCEDDTKLLPHPKLQFTTQLIIQEGERKNTVKSSIIHRVKAFGRSDVEYFSLGSLDRLTRNDLVKNNRLLFRLSKIDVE